MNGNRKSMKHYISMKKVIRKPLTKGINQVICTLLYTILLSASISVFAQEANVTGDSVRIVTGTVLDATTNAPISAAQITALNGQAAATTDSLGAFSIQIPLKTEVLLIKAFTYNEREIAVRGNNNLKVNLYSVAFSSLYGETEGLTERKRASQVIRSAVSTDNMEPLTYTSVDEVIQSRLGGDVRSVTRSGVSGIGAAMFIRGLNSVNANAQPLFVVDGVIWNNLYDVNSLHSGYFTNALADINMADIESVNIIKDGTSIYGSKGSNGVIIIKTTRGKNMATKIQLNTTFGVVSKPESLPVMDKDQFRLYTTDLLGSMSDNQIQSKFGSNGEGLLYLNDDPAKPTYNQYHNTTKWDDEVYQQGNFQSYNISVNGGDERALYAISLGYTGSKGVVNASDMQRLNSRFNADIALTKFMDMGLNIGFTNIDRNLLDDGAQFYTSPSYLAMIKAGFLSPYEYTPSGKITTDVEDSDNFGVGNPTAILQRALNSSKHYRFNMGIKPVFKITNKLTLSSQFDYSLDKVKEAYYSPIVGVAERYLPGYGISENMFRSQQMRNTGIFSDSRFQYKNLWGSYHRLNAFAGWRYISNYYESDFAEGHNSGSDQKRNLFGDQMYKTTLGKNDEIKSISNYANVEYSYDHRYFISASIAVDGSSNFGSQTKDGFQLGNTSWGVFPSIQGAWLMSSEEFLKNTHFVNQLKLRAGYSVTGNDNIIPYTSTAYFMSTRYMDRANGLILGNIGNSEIQWETTGKANAGIDALLFNDRLSISFDVYNSKTQDLLNLKALPKEVGTGYYWLNEGELSNKGYELSANVKLLNLKSFKWEIGAKLGKYTNTIDALPGGDFVTTIYGADILTSVGNAAGVFYGYKSSGVFRSEAEASAADLKLIDGEGIEHIFGAGDMHFEDVDGDGYITEEDRQIIGDPNPDFYGSFYSGFTVKRFTFHALLTYSYGNDVYNHLRANLESGSAFNNQSLAMTNRWFYEGQETNQPKPTYGDPMGNARFSDRWIEDGSYLRVKSLTLNYQVPIKGGVFEGLNVWVSANNVFTFTDYLGRDPEFSSGNGVLYQGIDAGLTPLTRSYFVGLKLNL